MTDEYEVATAELDAAVAIARHALEEFRREPMVPSKRGGARLSGWWVVYRDSSAIAVKWHRQLSRIEREGSQPAYLDHFDEFDQLLGEGS